MLNIFAVILSLKSPEDLTTGQCLRMVYRGRGPNEMISTVLKNDNCLIINILM